MKIVARVRDADFLAALVEAARDLSAELVAEPAGGDAAEPEGAADVFVVELPDDAPIDRLRALARHRGAALVTACHAQPDGCTESVVAEADEWLHLPVEAAELALRLTVARTRASGATATRHKRDAAELVRY